MYVSAFRDFDTRNTQHNTWSRDTRNALATPDLKHTRTQTIQEKLARSASSQTAHFIRWRELFHFAAVVRLGCTYAMVIITRQSEPASRLVGKRARDCSDRLHTDGRTGVCVVGKGIRQTNHAKRLAVSPGGLGGWLWWRGAKSTLLLCVRHVQPAFPLFVLECVECVEDARECVPARFHTSYV